MVLLKEFQALTALSPAERFVYLDRSGTRISHALWRYIISSKRRVYIRRVEFASLQVYLDIPTLSKEEVQYLQDFLQVARELKSLMNGKGCMYIPMDEREILSAALSRWSTWPFDLDTRPKAWSTRFCFNERMKEDAEKKNQVVYRYLSLACQRCGIYPAGLEDYCNVH